MQTKLFFYTLPAILLMAGSGLQAQSAENQLPLKISTKEQLHSTTQNGSAEFAITAENVFTFRKTAITTNTGDAEAIIRFTDVPGILTIQANSVKDQVCSFKEGDHNHVLISESADGITYTKETKYQANTSHDLTLSLEKTTRYVKFRYIVARNRAVILGWGSYCSHGFNPFSFQLPKTVDILPEDIQAEGFIGEVITKTISVGYSNPLGNLEIISSNPDFSIKKLTEQPEASASGISEYEVSFTATTAGQESTIIRVADSAYPEAAEEITMNAVVFDLKAPETLVVEAITLTSADLSWTPAEKAISYQVIVLDENKDVVSETNTDQTTHTCTELIPGKTYFIGIRSVGENGKLSVLSELQEITTHSLTAPGNIIAEQARTQLTFSWQAVAYAQEYQVTLTDKDNTIISEEVIPATQSSHTFANLKRGESYIFRIVSLAETESSAIAELATATLNDFGAQLENSGFENWESVDKGSEPLNWNSFGTVGGSMGGFAKAEQVAESSDVRPNSTGIKSAHLYSRMIGNISANGNMTTGRIFAGSWTPSDLSNYNAIVPADPAFRQIIEQQPDSVAIWIKYQPANPDSEDAVARLSFILHGEHESEIVKEPSAQESKLITSQAEMNYGPTQWQRISIPFVKKNDIQPKYMLASITTNQLPGIGTGGVDHVYADDAVLIYKPVLSVETPVIANLQEGDSFELSFTLTGTMSVSNIAADANTVHAELSDHTGSFDTPVVISEPVTTDESGTLQVKLPTRMISGDQYKIRVVTTNYPMTQEAAGNLAIEGSDTGTDLKETMTSGLKVYPNPAKERLFITGADNQNYRILNIAGRVIRATATYRSVEGIDTSVLTPGIYFIEINGAKSTEILKFIKE